VLLRHGTTRTRAEAILKDGPNPRYVEDGAEVASEGFAVVSAQGPCGFGTPQLCAVHKARLFPKELGPAILEFELSADLAAQLVASDQDPVHAHQALNGGEVITFDLGFGIEGLLQAWAKLPRRLVKVRGA
jgi:hypothetical protein